jgi:hypothetical protein
MRDFQLDFIVKAGSHSQLSVLPICVSGLMGFTNSLIFKYFYCLKIKVETAPAGVFYRGARRAAFAGKQALLNI